MIVKVKRFNSKREVVKTELHYPVMIRLQPAGLVELHFKDKDPQYIKFYPSDPLDIVVKDYIEDSNGDKSKLD
jgi:hypothetical protein